MVVLIMGFPVMACESVKFLNGWDFDPIIGFVVASTMAAFGLIGVSSEPGSGMVGLW
jgi:hypothetical protein